MRPSNEKEKDIRRRVHAKAILKSLTMREVVFKALELWLNQDNEQQKVTEKEVRHD